jgi:putative FmdB family regulatory protein
MKQQYIYFIEYIDGGGKHADFEYSCTKCGLRFEKLQKDITLQTAECPFCGPAEVKREMASFSSNSARGSASAASCFSGG